MYNLHFRGCKCPSLARYSDFIFRVTIFVILYPDLLELVTSSSYSVLIFNVLKADSIYGSPQVVKGPVTRFVEALLLLLYQLREEAY